MIATAPVPSQEPYYERVFGTVTRLDWDIALGPRSFANADSWLTPPVIVVTAIAIFGFLASPALLA
jgi:hypothetical protein